MPVLLQIALGGALGAVLRFLTVGQVARLFGTGLAVGTFSVNVIGSFLIGVAIFLLVRRADGEWSHMAPFFITGLLGGFTTFSTFSAEAVVLIEDGRFWPAALYVGGSVICGLAAFAGALALMRWLMS